MITNQKPGETLLELINSHRITAVISTAIKLGIPDVLAKGAQTSVGLAALCNAHEPSLQRLLLAMVTIGLCRTSNDGFELTAIGAPLASTAQPSLHDWAIFETERVAKSWTGLVDSVRTGKTATELEGGSDRFATMARDPAAVKTFNAAMVSLTRHVVGDVLATYDFSGVTCLMDVGGGNGELLVQILAKHPFMNGRVLDLPQCGDGARKKIVEAGLAARGQFIDGNFFDDVPPGADMIMLKSVIHDWNDERCAVILSNCREAMPAAGRLLMIERLLSAAPDVTSVDRANALSDLNMLRGPGGRERTEAEYRSLFAAAGLNVTRVLPAGLYGLIEAQRA